MIYRYCCRSSVSLLALLSSLMCSSLLPSLALLSLSLVSSLSSVLLAFEVKVLIGVGRFEVGDEDQPIVEDLSVTFSIFQTLAAFFNAILTFKELQVVVEVGIIDGVLKSEQDGLRNVVDVEASRRTEVGPTPTVGQLAVTPGSALLLR